MATPRNPRRVVLVNLRNVNRAMRWLVSRWDQPGTVFETFNQAADDGRVFVNHRTRPRTDAERIELSAREWTKLAADIGDVMEELGALQEYALAQYRALTLDPPR